MNESALRAVERAIEFMHSNLSEEVTIDDLAGAANFSKFHFTRLFGSVTGVSPARYLTALRLAEAKRLLLQSESSVAEISYQVGYNSPGTFSSRFKMCVGLSPTAFRRSSGCYPLRADSRAGLAQRSAATIHGRMHAFTPPTRGETFVGIFPDAILQGVPSIYSALLEPGPFTLAGVPDGTWYVHACAAAPVASMSATATELSAEPPYIASSGPIVVRSDVPAMAVELVLRPRCVFDPPVLMASPEISAVGRFGEFLLEEEASAG